MLFRRINKTFLLICLLMFILPNSTMAEIYTIDPSLSYIQPIPLWAYSGDELNERIALSGSLNFRLTDNLNGSPVLGIINIDTGGILPKDLPMGPFQFPNGIEIEINGASFFELNPCYFGGWCAVTPFGEFIQGTMSGVNLELKGLYPIDNFYHYDFNIEASITPIPEPTTTLLIGLGLMGLAGVRRKFKKYCST